MMVCTFGDKEDVDKWFRFKLPLRVVLEKNGRLNELAGEFKGMKIKEARKAIIDRLKETGTLVHQKEVTHAVNVHERCKTEIEFLKTKQWYIRILDQKEKLLRLAETITWYPPHMKVRYDHWVQNLNWDWCISRQRHFGIPIPVWRCAKCSTYVVPEAKALPVDPTLDMPKNACSCGSTKFVGETDVLDTWATSSVTPEITSNWVDRGEYDFKYLDKPFDLRPQAHDIIRTWLFYTLVKSYFHHGRAPWKQVMISGHAQDPHGRKMSKSLGNIVEPQEMIKKYSADALRFWAAGSTLGDDLPFQDKDLLTGQKFATKLWNAAKFCIMHLEDFSLELDERENVVTEVMDRWLLSKLQKVILECTESFDRFEYSKTKTRVEHFFWHEFCDQYLEIVKDRLYNSGVRGAEGKKSAQHTLYVTLLSILKMMAPITPHITEEVYHLFFAAREGKKSVHISSWPAAQQHLLDEQAELAGDVAVDIVSTVRRWKSEQKVSLKEEIATIVLIGEDKEFKEVVERVRDDLCAVLNTKKIVFAGPTTLVSEQYKIKVGIER